MSDVLELQDAIMSWISKPQAEFLQILDFNFKSFVSVSGLLKMEGYCYQTTNY